MRIFSVTAAYDRESGDWYVADSDVPGLAVGAPTLDALHERLNGAIADLVSLNAHQIAPALAQGEEVAFQLIVGPGEDRPSGSPPLGSRCSMMNL